MSATPTTREQPELFDAQQPVVPSEPAPTTPRALRRGPGGPGRVFLRPARHSIDVLDRPALEALCHSFGLSVVGERDEVLRDRLSIHLRCR